ncbi:hypothetical protein Scep_012742 [Stephania cephalantha]|uniref:EamA domain-containing protein n=1 Tax=Stephania cephalantha TaxID=152367 RepID=A0AAP0JFN4_9MAGN
MASSATTTTTTTNGGTDHLVELVGNGSNAAAVVDSLTEEAAAAAPLLQKPKINIFSLSYSRRKPKEQVVDLEVSVVARMVSWIWSGSKYSGFLCAAMSSVIYFVMAVLSEALSVQHIPIFLCIFTRCIIILISSFVWMRRTGQSMFGPRHARSLLVLRAIMGNLSLFSFAYSIQRLPLSNAIILNFMTPLIASTAAKIILKEKFELEDLGGQICSFIGLVLISPPARIMQGSVEAWDSNSTSSIRGNHPIYVVLVGVLSSVSGGISYCLVRAGAKASDQAVITVFYFSLLASPTAAMCAFVSDSVMLPDFYSVLVIFTLGLLAFSAEVFLARGLQLEKTSRIANIFFVEPLLLRIWSLGFSMATPAIGGLLGCFIILVSVCSTLYLGPEKEMS